MGLPARAAFMVATSRTAANVARFATPRRQGATLMTSATIAYTTSLHSPYVGVATLMLCASWLGRRGIDLLHGEDPQKESKKAQMDLNHPTIAHKKEGNMPLGNKEMMLSS
eukprot:m.36852 g.36852  ORF g.36852 m.36852 type:complete len:111 (-) comp9192_c1_seq1:248-580(-)